MRKSRLDDISYYPSLRVPVSSLLPYSYVGVEHLVKDRGGVCLSPDMPNADSAIQFRPGDILLGNIRPYLKKIWLADITGGASGDVIVVRIRDEYKDSITPDYLYKVLSSDQFFAYDNLNTKGAKMPRGDKKSIAAYLIPIPSIGEQKSIVDELDLLTSIIDKKNAQLRDLDALAQSIFYEMFGDPITNDKGWECCALKDVATIVGGSTPKTNNEEYWGGSNYWVTPAEIHGERYYGATERTISDLAVKSTNLTLLPIGTVLLSSRAPIGKVAITTVPMYCNQGFKNIICSDRLNNEYICQALLCKTDFLQALGTGATFKEISKKTTENIKMAIPPLALQKEFAAKAQMIEQQKKAVGQSLVDAQALFDSKMSHYFV